MEVLLGAFAVPRDGTAMTLRKVWVAPPRSHGMRQALSTSSDVLRALARPGASVRGSEQLAELRDHVPAREEAVEQDREAERAEAEPTNADRRRQPVAVQLDEQD